MSLRLSSFEFQFQIGILDVKIDQRRVDVSRTSSEVSCNEMCVSVGLSVCRSVCRRVFYLGVQMFCSEALSSSAFSTYPACIHVLLYCTYSCTVVSVPIQGLVSVADRVAARVIARERRGRILSPFHIFESMPKSVSKLIHYIHLVHGLILRLVYFLAPLVEIGSDLSVF